MTQSQGGESEGEGGTLTMEIQKKAIEKYFPIIEINRLAIPERNAFKPIYQMHKWFARRASCVHSLPLNKPKYNLTLI